MSTQNPTPDYAGLSKQEVAERLKNPTPDATATPRTRCELHQLNRQEYDTLKSMGLLWEVYPNAPDTFDEIDAPAKSKAKIAQLSKTVLDTIQLDREHHARALKAERELAAREAEVVQLKARLIPVGTFLLHLRDSTETSPNLGAHAFQLWRELNLPETPPSPTIVEALARAERAEAESAQLRAEVTQIASILPKTGHDTIGAAKDIVQDVIELRARVAELEADKARLDWLSTRFPDDDAGDCDPEGIERKWMSVWENSTEGSSLRAAIDAARAGKEKCPDGQCVKHRNINGGCDLCGAPSL